MRAFKAGVSVLDEATLNDLLLVTPFSLVFPGTVFDQKTGSGVYEHSLADYSYAIRIKATGVTEIGRIELNMDKDGTGADLVVEIRDADFNPDGSAEGTLLRTVMFPKEWIGDTVAYLSIPIALTGLTAGANYWLIIKRSGDATNKVDLHGEASQDAAHPCYRRAGDSGAWTAANAIHFRAYAGMGANRPPQVLHVFYGSDSYLTLERDGQGFLSTVWAMVADLEGNPHIRKKYAFPRAEGLYVTGGGEV